MDRATREVVGLAVPCSRSSTSTALELALKSVLALAGARYAALGVLDESQTELSRFLTVGRYEDARWLIGSLATKPARTSPRSGRSSAAEKVRQVGDRVNYVGWVDARLVHVLLAVLARSHEDRPEPRT